MTLHELVAFVGQVGRIVMAALREQSGRPGVLLSQGSTSYDVCGQAGSASSVTMGADSPF
jgi:hypothetical protein